MRRLLLAVSAAIAAITVLLTGSQFIEPVRAAANLAVHVHDDYYHPAGAFVIGPGTDHNVAKSFCQQSTPGTACDAHIQQGDTITWVSPNPFAVDLHTVTECTDSTFTVCGPSVDPANPIGDSGIRQPPLPGPSGWPYGPITFSDAGTYYYRCQIHPDVMRGRVVVAAFGGSVGGTVEILGSPLDGGSLTTLAIGAAAALVLLAGTGGVLAVQRVRRRGGKD